MTIENDPTPQTPRTYAEDQEKMPTNVPHSGIHHDEKPHVEFGSTTLEEAHAQNLLKIPEDPSALVPNKKHNRTIALIAGGAVLAAGGFLATQVGGKDKPKTVATTSSNSEPTAGASALTTQPSAEAPNVQLPVEGPREFIDGIPVLQLKDFTPTFGDETSAETLMTNFLTGYQNYSVMRFPEDQAIPRRVLQTLFAPGSPEIDKAVNISGDIFNWLLSHPTDARYYTWQLEKVVNGSLDQRTEDRWIVTAEILIGNTTEIEHHYGAFVFQKVEVPFADQPIWTLEIEYPKNAYTTPR